MSSRQEVLATILTEQVLPFAYDHRLRAFKLGEAKVDLSAASRMEDLLDLGGYVETIEDLDSHAVVYPRWGDPIALPKMARILADHADRQALELETQHVMAEAGSEFLVLPRLNWRE